ncbi:hypothetical protein B0T26DRAFT_873957 [Lasiosphaeria miniovina]|uniref:Uncharacterized protein n=1 Tax=Lasiosphaeria miniovina TaxID=1954250 RepID=A0AA40ADT6_9PEZI|nr:uncharacterized protein B0T26DRAFT_873957 [Lasiosphaeria miniovina]KAK0713949.1 hypothetical protein B0T26DRAFT_873957 [Lasiosphaeria miniovina]
MSLRGSVRNWMKRTNERTENANERANQAEAKDQPTTFLEYLHHLQTMVTPSLIIKNKTTAQSSGAATKVHGKVYPRALRRWDDFPSLCDKQFAAFVETFGEELLFPSWYSVKGAESNLSSDSRKDEQDIPSSAPTPKNLRCELLTNDIQRTALVGEYKAAHKAPARSFGQVLGNDPFPETLFEDCARSSEAAESEAEGQTEPGAERRAASGPPQHSILVAKVLCQAYHYMIISGLEYGYVASRDCIKSF